MSTGKKMERTDLQGQFRAGSASAKDAAGTARRGEYIGHQIRQIRKSRGMTLENLSNSTKLSIGYLSQIERNLARPAVDALMRIARELNVSSSMFYSPQGDEFTEGSGAIVRAGNRRVLKFGQGITDSLLISDLSGEIEFLLTDLEPFASSGDRPYSHAEEVVGLVIAGELEFWIKHEQFMLGVGDSFRCKPETPHRYRNPADHKASIVLALSLPTKSERRGFKRADSKVDLERNG